MLLIELHLCCFFRRTWLRCCSSCVTDQLSPLHGKFGLVGEVREALLCNESIRSPSKPVLLIVDLRGLRNMSLSHKVNVQNYSMCRRMSWSSRELSKQITYRYNGYYGICRVQSYEQLVPLRLLNPGRSRQNKKN